VSESREPDGEQGLPRDRESSASASRSKGQTAWITKGGQLVGLAIGFNQGLLMEHPNRDLVLLAIVLVLGGQAVENLLFRAIDRFFDRQD
jgi:hypothetical protein